MAEAVPTRRAARTTGAAATPLEDGTTGAPFLTRRELRALQDVAIAVATAELDAAAAAIAAEATAGSDVAPIVAAPAAVQVPRTATAIATQGEASTPPAVDFDTAARLFSFTGETALPAPTALPAATAPRRAAPGQSESAALKRPAASPGAKRAPRRWAAAAFSAGVMSIVGLLAVSVTAPAEAVAAASDTLAVTSVAPPAPTAKIKPEEIQAFVAPAEGEVVQLDREQNYALTTFDEIARESGINMSPIFVNDANSEVQWPFAVGVGMSYGYGMRSGRMHEGIDFTPGSGAQVQAIAEGTVRIATEAGGAYGVSVYIDHVVDGQRISSHYAHMQHGSLQVSVGQHVVAGDPVGRVGNTGRSFGAHLHFELRIDGKAAIDPLPWLQKHAGGWQG